MSSELDAFRQPPSIEVGDQICINITKGILWIENEKKPEDTPPVQVPQTPNENGPLKHYFHVGEMLKGKKNPDDAWRIAFNLAGMVIWSKGFTLGDITNHYLKQNEVLVFEVIKVAGR